MGRLILGLALMFQLAGAVPAPLSNADLRAQMVGYWKMDEAANANRRTTFPAPAAGTDLTDVDTNHGQGTGLVYTNATDFAGGADGAFELLNAGAVGHLVGKTACLWFKETADANSNLFTMGEGITGQDEEWELTYIAAGDNLAFAGFADHADGNASQAIITATTNTWHLACMALDDTTHKAQLSVDGAAFSFGGAMGGDPAFNQDATADLVVGSYPGNYVSKFTGQVGPVMIFSAILTGPQLVRLYGASAGLALYR